MKIAICVDDRMGMSFNNRRQSRDRAVYEDMIAEGGGIMAVTPFSQRLFKNDPRVRLYSPDEPTSLLFLEYGDCSDYPFTELILYFWNRLYPADKFLNIDLGKFQLTETLELSSPTHKCITKRRYLKK